MDQSSTIPPDVATSYSDMPEDIQPRLFEMRRLLFDVAERTTGVGKIVETLKWGQPSYLTAQPKSGSTVRLGQSKDGRAALFCHCQTSLVQQYRNLYPDVFDFEGNRALVLKPGPLPQAELEHCIALALTYHLRRRRAA